MKSLIAKQAAVKRILNMQLFKTLRAAQLEKVAIGRPRREKDYFVN